MLRKARLLLLAATSTVAAGLIALGAAAVAPHAAHASTAIALSVEDLVDRSETVVVGIPKSKTSRWEGGRIITYTTVAIDTAVAGAGGKKAGESIVVRTLGGTVDGIGQITHGEAVLPVDKPMVLFLRAMPPGGKALAGALTVTGMAQGALAVEVGPDKVARVIARPVDLVLVPNAKVDPKTAPKPAAETLAGKALPTVVTELRALWAARGKK
ncbi:MAG: hypothetical protein HYV09_39470 [Deltaproteobacteria bacterium]|nr:hypothetical protein [Deltaproteobacteria bacterium]